MGTLKHCGLILLLLLLLTGCEQRLDVLTVVGVYDDQLKVTDGGLTYLLDEEGELTSPKKEFKQIESIAPLSSYGTEYSLKHTELNRYQGELKDAIAYYNYLINDGFESVSLTYYANYFDALVTYPDGDEVRILYLGNSIVRVFYRNTSNSNLFAPYINEEG